MPLITLKNHRPVFHGLQAIYSLQRSVAARGHHFSTSGITHYNDSSKPQQSTAMSHSKLPDAMPCQRVGVLLVNLGTPAAPTARAVRNYLREFLSDPRVVDAPRVLWWLILNMVILPLRPRRSAKLYKKIWTPEGSPLLAHSLMQRDKLEQRLNGEDNGQFKIAVGMRYGKPSIAQALNELGDRDVKKIIVLPLYPQFCSATTASAFDGLAQALAGQRHIPELYFVSDYHDFPPFIEACAKAISASWLESGRPDHLVLSYHGVPRRYVAAGDPYYHQCLATSTLIAERLALKETDYQTTFQSRFGREEWLQPYTDAALRTLAESGEKKVQVFCPGFAADCLETLEEIADENRNYFLASGGEAFTYTPALNADDSHIEALYQLVQAKIING